MSLPSIANRLLSRVRGGVHLLEETIRRWSSPDIVDDAVVAPPYEPGSDTNKVYHEKTAEQRQRLEHALLEVFLFKILNSEQMQDILDAMEERKVVANEEIVREGDEGDYLYVIDHGCFTAHNKSEDGTEREIFKYTNKGSFGELALMYFTKRQATVVADTEGSLWTLDRDTFRRLVLNRAYEKRLTYDRFLRTVPTLQSLTDYERMNVADALVSLEVTDGTRIIRQGDAAVDGMYFVEEGSCRVMYRNEDGDERLLNLVLKGDYFGELALITNHARYASVYAIGATRLAFLDVSAFERLLGPCVEIMQRNFAHYDQQIAALTRPAMLPPPVAAAAESSSVADIASRADDAPMDDETPAAAAN